MAAAIEHPDLGVSDLEAVEAVFFNEDLYRLGETSVVRDPTKGGRPRDYPDYFVVAMDSLAAIYQSVRAATGALHGPLLWDHIRSIVNEMCPNDPTMWLPENPPERTWYYKRRNLITDEPHDRTDRDNLEHVRHRFSETGVETARELGHLDPDGPGSPTRPDQTRVIHHDGKVIKQMYNSAEGDTRQVKIKNDKTGEIIVEERPVRSDPDAKVHVTGDKRQIHGCKFWHAEVRGDERFSRVFLSVDHVPSVKGEHNSEPDIAVKNLLALAPLAPGVQGMTCDTALRGTHLDALQRATGWTCVNPVTAESVDEKTGDRTEKERFHRTVVFKYHDGTTSEVDVWRSGGALAAIDYSDDGTAFLTPLPRTENVVRQNDDGTYRTYVVYAVPCPRGGEPETIWERTFQLPVDGKFNRAENIRQIPPGDPDYARLMGRRSDAESANRRIDDRLYLRRARSIGARRQLFDLICHAFLENSIARHRHRLRNTVRKKVAA